MPNAYVETTILTDLLLKPYSHKQERAKAALARYDSTLLPVYSIKEWKAGPLYYFVYVHNKLVTTQSFANTLQAIAALPLGYRRSTAQEALAAAGQQLRRQPQNFTVLGNTDKDHADSYRLSLASIIIRSWNKRRKVTTQVVQELPCYLEAAPSIGTDRLFDLSPRHCQIDEECSLAVKLKSNPELLEALRDAIPANSTRREDQKRRKALKHLIKHPDWIFTRDLCRDLGDAIYAFFCPAGAVVLTTNLRDHERLTKALGKLAEKP